MLEVEHPAWQMNWPAPAKLNLLLHVVGQRADGYHLLETAFQLLSHGDTLRFSPRPDSTIVRQGGLASVAAEDDLVVRAARILFAATQCPHGVNIELTKRLPAGGGLGGGSSDAATVLRVLNNLYQLELGVDELARLGLQLGADVPLFVRGYSAWAQGVGEKLAPMELPEQWFLVATPDVAIATENIFGHPDLCRSTPSVDVGSLDFSAGHLPGRNDCQAVATAQFPAVKALLSCMSEHAPTRMTGTGSSVFSIFSSQQDALNAAARLPKGVNSFVSLGVNQSMLQNKLTKLFSSK